MTPDDFLRWLIAGSYIFSAGSYVFGWRILLSLKRIEQVLAREQGLTEGQDVMGRIGQIERNHRSTERQDLDYRVTRLEEQWRHRKQRGSPRPPSGPRPHPSDSTSG